MLENRALHESTYKNGVFTPGVVKSSGLTVLVRLPTLFSAEFVIPDEHLHYMETLAFHQKRLLRWVFRGVAAVAALSCTPFLSGPGPLLTWAAQIWPSVFGSLYAWTALPISPEELFGSACLLLLFIGVHARETYLLRRFSEDLLLLDFNTSVLDALNRLAVTSGPVCRYLGSVRNVRPLRLGDWRVARALGELPAK